MIKQGLAFPFIYLILVIVIELVASKLSKDGVLKPSLRKLAAIDAIDEAVGRSTEMGRPVHCRLIWQTLF